MRIKLIGDLFAGTQALKYKYGIGKGGRVQATIDKRVMDYCKPYVPMQTGVLANSPYTMTVLGSGEVIYPGPYAHYQYYGEIYGPNIPIEGAEGNVIWRSKKGSKKEPTGRSLTYNTDYNPLAGSYWFERMKADHCEDIVREARQEMLYGRRR